MLRCALLLTVLVAPVLQLFVVVGCEMGLDASASHPKAFGPGVQATGGKPEEGLIDRVELALVSEGFRGRPGRGGSRAQGAGV